MVKVVEVEVDTDRVEAVEWVDKVEVVAWVEDKVEVKVVVVVGKLVFAYVLTAVPRYHTNLECPVCRQIVLSVEHQW